MTDGARVELAQRIETIESAYEFMLAYAAQGREGETDTGPGPHIRQFLSDLVAALENLGAVCLQISAADPIQRFSEILDADAGRAQVAIEVVLAQPAISSQLVDNLNASMHLRGLLTDLFLIDEALKNSSK